MSIPFDTKIFSGNGDTLKLNFFGIKNGVTTVSDLKMSIYAYNTDGQPKFSASL